MIVMATTLEAMYRQANLADMYAQVLAKTGDL